jgi:hypothetical protein
MQPAGEVLLEFAAGLERFRSRVLDAAIQQEADEVQCLPFSARLCSVALYSFGFCCVQGSVVWGGGQQKRSCFVFDAA